MHVRIYAEDNEWQYKTGDDPSKRYFGNVYSFWDALARRHHGWDEFEEARRTAKRNLVIDAFIRRYENGEFEDLSTLSPKEETTMTKKTPSRNTLSFRQIAEYQPKPRLELGNKTRPCRNLAELERTGYSPQ